MSSWEKGTGRRGGRRSTGAFTLVELMGVLTIILILGSVATVGVVDRVKEANRDAERTSLGTLVSSYHEFVARTRSVPGSNTLASAMADYLSLAVNRVTTNGAGLRRLIVYDPAMQVGPGAGALPPYSQTSTGSVRPANARMLIVSSIGATLPNVTLNATTFSNLWNTPSNSVPADWVGWSGSGRDLQIARANLAGLFRHVILDNMDLNRGAPYSVDTTNGLTTIPAGQRREFWLIDTSAMNFHLADTSLQAREFITEDVSYTFEDGKWRRYPRYGRGGSSGWFGDMVDQFIAAPQPPACNRRYSCQRWVCDSMHEFMKNYAEWSDDDFGGHGNWPHCPGYDKACNGKTCLQNYSRDLCDY